MKLTINYEGKPIYGKIPANWSELSVKQFTALEGNKSPLELLSILSGIDIDIIQNIEADLTPYVNEISARFNEQPPDLSKAPRKDVTICGKLVKFPKTIEFTRYGQKSLTRTLLQNTERIEDIISDVFAIYAQPLIDGKFSTERIDFIKREVEQLPIIEVYPHVVFFFKKLSVLRNTLAIN